MIKRAPTKWHRAKPWVWGILFAGVAGLALVQLAQPESWESGAVPPPFPDVLLALAQMFIGEGPTGVADPAPFWLRVAFLAAIVVTITALLEGVLSLFSWFYDAAVVFAGYHHDHIVICGLSRMGLHLAREFKQAGERVIVIERDGDNPNLDEARDERLRVHLGDATQAVTLRDARAHRARRVICVTDDDTNSEIVHALDEMTQDGKHRPPCHVHLANRRLFRSLYDTQMERRAAGAAPSPGSDRDTPPLPVDYFNLATWGAPCLTKWCWQPPAAGGRDPRDFRCAPLFSTDGTQNHFIVVGAGTLGQAFIVDCTRRYIARPEHDPKQQLIFTIVDRAANRQQQELDFYHPSLAKIWQLRPFEMAVPGLAYDRGDFLRGTNLPPPRRVFICLADDTASLVAGLQMVRVLRQAGHQETLVLVRVDEEKGLMWTEELREENSPRGKQLKPFKILDETMKVDFMRFAPPDHIAKALHEAYLAQQKADNPNATPEEKPAMVEWEDLAEEYRESSRNQAVSIEEALAALPRPRTIVVGGTTAALSRDDIEVLARREHDRWMNEKIANGWTYAPVRDNTAKHHPNLLPWEEIDEPTRQIDRDMVEAWPKALAAAGLGIAAAPPGPRGASR